MQRFLRQLVDSSRFLELDTIFIRRIGSHLEESYSEGYDVGGGGWCGVWSPGCDGVFGAVKFGKVMFLHLCHSVQGGVSASVHAGIADPPEADTTPRSRTPTPPPGSRHPPVQCMLGDTANLQVVHILLECILVIIIFTSVSRILSMGGGRGACMAGEHAWQGACMEGGACVAEGGMCGRKNSPIRD